MMFPLVAASAASHDQNEPRVDLTPTLDPYLTDRNERLIARLRNQGQTQV